MLPILRVLASSALVATVALQSNAGAQTTVWSDDLEGGSSQWATTGLWHWIRHTNSCAGPALPFPSATHVMWYGIDGQCDFDNGLTNTGVLRTVTPVALPSTGQGLVLRYHDWRHAELCGCPIGSPYDHMEVDVSVNNGSTWTSLREECQPQFPWRKGRADLTPYAGTSVLIRFKVDTIDEVNNNTLGWLIDDVSIQLEAGRSYCETFGCPCVPGTSCAQPYNVGGCKNSTSTTGGAEVFGGGTPSVASDDVVLTIEGMPPTSFVTFLQGDLASNSVLFGDGLRCIGGTLLRLAIKPAVNGVATYPEPGDQTLSVRGGIPTGGGVSVGYQGHYRDSAVHCTNDTFNMTNGYRVDWLP